MIPNLFPVLIHLPTYVGFYFLNTTQNNLQTRSLHFIPPPISPDLPSPAVPSLVVVVVVVARRGSCRGPDMGRFVVEWSARSKRDLG